MAIGAAQGGADGRPCNVFLHQQNRGQACKNSIGPAGATADFWYESAWGGVSAAAPRGRARERGAPGRHREAEAVTPSHAGAKGTPTPAPHPAAHTTFKPSKIPPCNALLTHPRRRAGFCIG